MTRTGSSAIRSVHNGPAQVAQVFVCHALGAVREIGGGGGAFPQSWHVCEKHCVCRRKRKMWGGVE